MAPQTAQRIVVWESEWPQLKSLVTAVREATHSSASQMRTSVTETSVTHAKNTLTRIDQEVHERSLLFSRFCFQNPWVFNASAITGAATFVAAKSARWGAYASMRNGVATAVVAAVCIFPEEIKTASRRFFDAESARLL
jgi:hypothetical protein